LEGKTNAAQVRCLGRFCVEIRNLGPPEYEAARNVFKTHFNIIPLLYPDSFFMSVLTSCVLQAQKSTCSHRK